MMTLPQKLDPTYRMGDDFMRPAYNSVPRYRVIVPTTEEWADTPGAPSEVKGLIWYTDKS
jgi:hypothetical protein